MGFVRVSEDHVQDGRQYAAAGTYVLADDAERLGIKGEPTDSVPPGTQVAHVPDPLPPIRPGFSNRWGEASAIAAAHGAALTADGAHSSVVSEEVRRVQDEELAKTEDVQEVAGQGESFSEPAEQAKARKAVNNKARRQPPEDK